MAKKWGDTSEIESFGRASCTGVRACGVCGAQARSGRCRTGTGSIHGLRCYQRRGPSEQQTNFGVGFGRRWQGRPERHCWSSGALHPDPVVRDGLSERCGQRGGCVAVSSAVFGDSRRAEVWCRYAAPHPECSCADSGASFPAQCATRNGAGGCTSSALASGRACSGNNTCDRDAPTS